MQGPSLPTHDPLWDQEHGHVPSILTLQVRGPYTLNAPPRQPADVQTSHHPGQELRASWGPRAAHPTLIYPEVFPCPRPDPGLWILWLWVLSSRIFPQNSSR